MPIKSKKQLILLVLKVLESQTDKEHPMSQVKIAEFFSESKECDRKTIGRNIKYLKEIGYPIVKTKEGYYLDRKKFSLEERDFIIDAINSSSKKSEEEKEDLIKRLLPILGKIYRENKKES